MPPLVRLARPEDIGAMHRLRLSVSENRLPAASGIDEESYAPFVENGSAWVAESGGRLLGFAALYHRSGSVWALFVDPEAEGQGVGTALHRQMLLWATQAGLDRLRLTTQTGSRAELFYRAAGWRDEGLSSKGERRFLLELQVRDAPEV